MTLRLKAGESWLIYETGIGKTNHQGPIEVDPSGALILYEESDFGSLDAVKVFGPGMWIRSERKKS